MSYEYIPSNQKKQEKSTWYTPIKESIAYFYMQFLLVTTLYVMEPWECILMIGIFMLVLSLFSYSAFVFIPYHLHKILQVTMPSFTEIAIS